jgi:hypothetical protein
MKRYLGAFASVGLLLGMLAGETALAQKPGGVLKMSHFDSPASMSLHEEATAAANRPMMGVFNNLVMYKQDAPQNTMQSIVVRGNQGENRIASPEMFPEAEMLPHLICSRPMFIGGANDEAHQYGGA